MMSRFPPEDAIFFVHVLHVWPYLELVLALKDEVRLFVANGMGEAPERYVSDGKVLQLPKEAEVYGVAASGTNGRQESAISVELLENRGLKLRYSGSFTGDVNSSSHQRRLLRFTLSSSMLQTENLRLQFESNPVAFIIEKAGGSATVGMQRILDVEPMTLHTRSNISRQR